MRTLIAGISLLLSIAGSAQQNTIKTETFAVSGNCEQCKERIENAADIKGVKIAKWDVRTKVATVTYDSTKTDLLKIRQSIASKGHDAGDIKAADKDYKRLPSCCRYRDKKCEEPGKK